MVDFQGFIKMIDALGGVQICIPNDISSPNANHLRLTAGLHKLNGTIALDYARAREGKGLGDGSDLNRIPRQHALLAALVRQAQSQNLLTNVPALLQVLNAATSSVTASPDLADLRKLTGLAFSLRGTSAANITFMTIPIGAEPTNKDRVVMAPAAARIWANMVADKPLVAAPVATAPATPAPGATTAPTTAPPTTTKTPGRGAITAADVPSACG